MPDEQNAYHLPGNIQSYYERFNEAGRLDHPEGQIEKLRTRELMRRYLPPPPAVILDVGGGSGVHAFWLSEQGYQVHLIDPVPRHIEQAEKTARKFKSNSLASVKLGEARQLDHEDNSVDGVLLFGPLYHLTDRKERLHALSEARRVLQPGGVIMAAAITRFASTIIALLKGLVADPIFTPIYEKDLRDGQHRNPTADPGYFTDSYFHYPQELIDEIIAAGFMFETLLAIEGPTLLMEDFTQKWEDKEIRRKLLAIVRQVEAEPNLWGVSAHIMGIGKKE
jgi:ubiquinone/menaquinone biosynthesis C-methylase UbiE